MVSQLQTAGGKSNLDPARVRRSPSYKRLPLLWSLLGALAASLLLWSGIFFVIDFVAHWLSGSQPWI